MFGPGPVLTPHGAGSIRQGVVITREHKRGRAGSEPLFLSCEARKGKPCSQGLLRHRLPYKSAVKKLTCVRLDGVYRAGYTPGLLAGPRHYLHNKEPDWR